MQAAGIEVSLVTHFFGGLGSTFPISGVGQPTPAPNFLKARLKRFDRYETKNTQEH